MSFTENLLMKAANFMPMRIDGAVKQLAANPSVIRLIDRLDTHKLSVLEKLDNILVVSDTNIGDAVNIQSLIEVLKHHLPPCEIDFVYQKEADPLIRNNPNIRHAYPVLTDSAFTSKRNKGAIRKIVENNSYDFIMNLYPFFSKSELKRVKCPLLMPLKLVANIVNTYASSSEPSHVCYQLNRYGNGLVKLLPPSLRREKGAHNFSGSTIYLSEAAKKKSLQLLKELDISPQAHTAFINPDTSSPYSLVPIGLQAGIIQGLVDMDRFSYVLLGPGYSFCNIQRKVYSRLQKTTGTNKVVLLPEGIPIDAYTGLIDTSDLFITGDTAQMHIASARKIAVESDDCFRNRTAIINIFGATSSRIYGYDSASPLHLSSTQNSVSKVFEGIPVCKNLTCVHKVGKTCREVRCFNTLTSKEILDFIKDEINI